MRHVPGCFPCNFLPSRPTMSAMPDIRHVHIAYDPDAEVWWAESDDLPGLVSEAPTLDGLIERVMAVAGELLQANGQNPDGVSLQFITTRQLQAA